MQRKLKIVSLRSAVLSESDMVLKWVGGCAEVGGWVVLRYVGDV